MENKSFKYDLYEIRPHNPQVMRYFRKNILIFWHHTNYNIKTNTPCPQTWKWLKKHKNLIILPCQMAQKFWKSEVLRDSCSQTLLELLSFSTLFFISKRCNTTVAGKSYHHIARNNKPLLFIFSNAVNDELNIKC